MRKPQTKASHLQLVPNVPPSEAQAVEPDLPSTRPWALGALAVLALGIGSAYASWRDAPVAGSELQSAFPAATEPTLALDVFAHPRGNPMTAQRLADRDTAHAGDAYTFVVHNRTNAPSRFMLFGVDEHNSFFWFYPSRDGSRQAPAAVAMPLSASPMTTLPEVVTPALTAGSFQIFGLFTDKPPTVAEVETAFGHGGADALRAELAAQVQAIRLSIE